MGSNVKDGLVRLEVLQVRCKILNCVTLKFPISVFLDFLAVSSSPFLH